MHYVVLCTYEMSKRKQVNKHKQNYKKRNKCFLEKRRNDFSGGQRTTSYLAAVGNKT